MVARVAPKDVEYILNLSAKYLARDNIEERHNFFGESVGQERARFSEAWRFPIVDAHDGVEEDRYEWNDVTFVYAVDRGANPPTAVGLVSTCARLYEPLPLVRVDDSLYWAVTLAVPKSRRYRYQFVVDGALQLDPINPQTEVLPTGETWSAFFTWAYNQPINFERWEMDLLDRLTRHLLPFNSREARNFLERGVNEGNVGHLYRLDMSAGVANYIDNIVAREERHQLAAYKTCLEMLDLILRRRHPGRAPASLEESEYVRLYDEMAERRPVLFDDGWDRARYSDPGYFLYLLRRHAWTGAFSHPKYGGNPGGLGWAYLSETYRTSDDNPPKTAFAWRQAIEAPLGISDEYLG